MFNFFKSSVKETDISLLIQGPFNTECFNSIKSSKFKFKQIIYSTWANENIDYSNFKNLEGFEAVIQDLPDVTNITNIANIYYQICSTLEGLKLVKTKYVMKHRADESYNKLNLVIEKFDPQKLLCSNIYFRPIKYQAFHISDHFFIGETSRLTETFSELKKYFDGKNDYLKILDVRHAPEQMIALFYLATFGYKIEELLDSKKDKDFVFEIMVKHFDVFDVKHLKPYSIKHNHLKSIIYDLKKVDKNILLKYIANMKDIKS